MERLTERDEDGNAYWIEGDCQCYIDNESNLYGGAIDKLAEYEDLDEQGLILRLPHGINKPCYVVERCQCGTHYNCRSNRKASARRKAIVIGKKKTVDGYNRCMKIFERPFKVSYLNKIGVSVFLTRTEAEEALKKMEKEK